MPGDNDEINNFLDSDKGSGAVTVIAIVLGLTFYTYFVIIPFQGWARVIAIVVSVLVLLALVWWLFFGKRRD